MESQSAGKQSWSGVRRDPTVSRPRAKTKLFKWKSFDVQGENPFIISCQKKKEKKKCNILSFHHLITACLDVVPSEQFSSLLLSSVWVSANKATSLNIHLVHKLPLNVTAKCGCICLIKTLSTLAGSQRRSHPPEEGERRNFGVHIMRLHASLDHL